MTRVVLVVAAHPDDEVIGCGGCIARHVAEGDAVHLVLATDGVGARLDAGAAEIARRRDAAERARIALGIRAISWLGLPDNRLDSVPLLDIVQRIEEVLRRLAPELVYTHHHGDLNIDHGLVHKAVLTACRPVPACPVREILAFETVSSTEWSSPERGPFLPNVFVDVTAYQQAKFAALAIYAMEMRAPPHARSLEHVQALMRHRGHCVGVEAAEAFMAVRVLR